jgi:hypothetical protein
LKAEVKAGELIFAVRAVCLEGVPQEPVVFLLLQTLERERQVAVQFGGREPSVIRAFS